MPTASVKLTVDGEEILNAGVGIGPVDAAINAVNSLEIFNDINFIEYHVDAITGGTDALIDVIIKLQKMIGLFLHEVLNQTLLMLVLKHILRV